MVEKLGDKSLFKLDQFIYPKFRGKIIDLYLHAFTSGDLAQYIDPHIAGSTLDSLIRKGWGNMLFVGDRLVGVALAMSLLEDADFPAAELPAVPVERSLYISEVMVHADFRGRGIGTRLVNDLLLRAGDTFSNAVIRVWEQNEPALSLYRKLGFHPVAMIRQTKLRAPGHPFEMKKIYLLKRIRSTA
jgi:ribosomal protein S18 acetylase RimI-like enzyme